MQEYNAVLELNPGNVHGETEMAIAMMQLGALNEPAAAASMRLRAGQLDDAKQHLQAVVSRNPDWVSARS